MNRSSTANSRRAKHTDDRKKNAEAAVDEPNSACLSFYPCAAQTDLFHSREGQKIRWMLK